MPEAQASSLEEFNDECNRHATWPLGDGTEDPSSELTELLETGSVTVEVGGQKWQLSLKVERVFE